MRILGYADRFSVAPGDSIRFMVSCDGHKKYDAQIVRLIHGDTNPAGEGYREEEIAADVNGSYRGRLQRAYSGSYVLVPGKPPLAALTSFTVAAMIWPTTPAKGRQGLVSQWDAAQKRGWALVIDEAGSAALVLGDGQSEQIFSAGPKLLPREWYCVGASYDAQTGRAVVWQHPVNDLRRRHPWRGDPGGRVQFRRQRRAAGHGSLGQRQRGKARRLCRPLQRQDRFAAAVQPCARSQGGRPLGARADGGPAPRHRRGLGFRRDITTIRVRDLSPSKLHGKAVNLPARAMKGYNWTGAEMNWTARPEQYGAIHFHDDDIYDAGWEPDFAFTVPEGLRSGIYAARLRAGEDEDHIPFFVRAEARHDDRRHRLPGADRQLHGLRQRPRAGRTRAGAEMLMGRLIVLQPQDLHMAEHRGAGRLALRHPFRRQRRLLLLAAAADPEHAAALFVLAGRQRLRPLAVQRRLAPHRLAGGQGASTTTSSPTRTCTPRGYDLLKPYRVVLTGTHPEYYSTRDAGRAAGLHRAAAGG